MTKPVLAPNQHTSGTTHPPTYKNRKEMSSDTQVFHYTTLEAVIAMGCDHQMRLTRLDSFDDPFEGSFPKNQTDARISPFSSAASNESAMGAILAGYPKKGYEPEPYRDPWEQATQRQKAKTRSAHAICWAAGDESEAMWKLYCTDEGIKGQGLALCTTLGKLEASVSGHDLYVSPVRYRYYHEGDAFDDELDPFLHKRKGFEYENEVRLLKYDNAQYLRLCPFDFRDTMAEPPPNELPKHIFLNWSLTTSVDKIIVSPYADETYEAKARSEIATVNSVLVERMELSILSSRLYPANF